MVSIPSVTERKSIPTFAQIFHEADEAAHRAAEPIKPPHNQAIATAKVRDRIHEAGTIVTRPARLVFK